MVIGAGGRTFEARRAIVTLPLAILKDRNVVFDPALPPEKCTAIDALETGMRAAQEVMLSVERASA